MGETMKGRKKGLEEIERDERKKERIGMGRD